MKNEQIHVYIFVQTAGLTYTRLYVIIKSQQGTRPIENNRLQVRSGRTRVRRLRAKDHGHPPASPYHPPWHHSTRGGGFCTAAAPPSKMKKRGGEKVTNIERLCQHINALNNPRRVFNALAALAEADPDFLKNEMKNYKSTGGAEYERKRD